MSQLQFLCWRQMLRDILACHKMEFFVNFPKRVTNDTETTLDNLLVHNKRVL